MSEHFTFVETTVFSRLIAGLISEGQLAELQAELMQNPEKGPVIQGTGGLRKVRWGARGRGKSGGIRILYLYLKIHGIIYLVFAFAKGESDNITAAEKKQLKLLVNQIKQEYRS